MIIVIEFMFLGPSQAHFSPAARAKMSLSRAQYMFMPANINSIVLLAAFVHVHQNTQNLAISRCCFVEDGKEMYKVLVVKPVVVGVLVAVAVVVCLRPLMRYNTSHFDIAYLVNIFQSRWIARNSY